MRERFVPLGDWAKRGYDLGLGIGIAQGYATLGAIGFEGRWDYAAIGNVTNLAARLCGEAKAGQVLLDRKTMAALDGAFGRRPSARSRSRAFRSRCRRSRSSADGHQRPIDAAQVKSAR